MGISSQYRASLKHPQAEELADLYIFRPIAFLIAKALVHTPVTPNQITSAALVAGLVAGFSFSTGTPQGFLIGALVYALSNTLDCADGMVARMKGNGTQLGRMIDVFADLITGTVLYIGIGVGLSHGGVPLPFNAIALMFVGGISVAVQFGIFDKERNHFLTRLHDDAEEQRVELVGLERELATSNEWWGKKLLTRQYIRFTQGQLRGLDTSPRLDAKQSARLLRLWSIIGSSSHAVVLVVAMAFDKPMVLFYYGIVVGNLWALGVRLYQRHLENPQMGRKWAMGSRQ
jgi:phosphatidylglycerophosphate synthase